MTFRSIDHSSPVSVDIKLEDLPSAWGSLSPNTPQVSVPSYDDSTLRASIEHLHGEIFRLQERIGEISRQPLPVVVPKFDYEWAEKQLNMVGIELMKVALREERLEEIMVKFIKDALGKIDERPNPVIQLPEKPIDRSLQIAAIISSSSLLTITVLVVLQFLHH